MLCMQCYLSWFCTSQLSRAGLICQRTTLTERTVLLPEPTKAQKYLDYPFFPIPPSPPSPNNGVGYVLISQRITFRVLQSQGIKLQVAEKQPGSGTNQRKVLLRLMGTLTWYNLLFLDVFPCYCLALQLIKLLRQWSYSYFCYLTLNYLGTAYPVCAWLHQFSTLWPLSLSYPRLC